MAIDPKSLTIDYKTLMNNTSISERVGLTKSSAGQQLLSSLSPTDLASAFPDYYKKNNPDVSGFIEATSRRYGKGKDKTPGTEFAQPAEPGSKTGPSNLGSKDKTPGTEFAQPAEPGSKTGPSNLGRPREGGRTDLEAVEKAATGSTSKNSQYWAKASYNAFLEAGASDAQARALVRQVSRENSFNPNLMFGTHSEPAKNAAYGRTNYGIFSWGDPARVKEFKSYMTSASIMDKDGKIIVDNETYLKAQARFIMQTELPKTKNGQAFLDNKDIDTETADAQLASYIGWDVKGRYHNVNNSFKNLEYGTTTLNAALKNKNLEQLPMNPTKVDIDKATATLANSENNSGLLVPGFSGRVGSMPGDSRDNGHRAHAGTDISMPYGSPILARQDGVIIKSEIQDTKINRGYGGTAGGIVTIRYTDGHIEKHMHTSDQYDEGGPVVKAGQVVRAGDLIGRSGVAAKENHLHIEGRKGDNLTLEQMQEIVAAKGPGALEQGQYAGNFVDLSKLYNFRRGEKVETGQNQDKTNGRPSSETMATDAAKFVPFAPGAPSGSQQPAAAPPGARTPGIKAPGPGQPEPPGTMATDAAKFVPFSPGSQQPEQQQYQLNMPQLRKEAREKYGILAPSDDKELDKKIHDTFKEKYGITPNNNGQFTASDVEVNGASSKFETEFPNKKANDYINKIDRQSAIEQQPEAAVAAYGDEQTTSDQSNIKAFPIKDDLKSGNENTALVDMTPGKEPQMVTAMNSNESITSEPDKNKFGVTPEFKNRPDQLKSKEDDKTQKESIQNFENTQERIQQTANNPPYSPMNIASQINDVVPTDHVLNSTMGRYVARTNFSEQGQHHSYGAANYKSNYG